KCTSSGSLAVNTEASTYTQPAWGPADESIAIQYWPSNPSGFGGTPPLMVPPRSGNDVVKIGGAPLAAFVERATTMPVPPVLAPTMYSVQSAATSSVP